MIDPILVFSLLVVAAGLAAFVFNVLRLPLLISYVVCGLVLGLFVVTSDARATISFLPEIGLAFLLFLIGLELDIREIKHLGKQIVLASAGQMLISTLLITIIALVLGFAQIDALLLGLGVAFSSTVVVVKLFVDKKEIASLHGKIAVGICIFEDLVAVLVLMLLTLKPSELGLGFTLHLPFLAFLVKGALLFAVVYVCSKFLLPYFLKVSARSQELLFLSAIALCFAFIALSFILGFGFEIGAFLAGIILASSTYKIQIAGRIKPLRDLFITLFFVDLGLRVAFSLSHIRWVTVLIFSLYAFLVKPAIFMSLLGRLGYKRQTGFLTSTAMAQISEFSLILLSVAVANRKIGEASLSTLAISALITMTSSSLIVTHSRKIYKKVGRFLKIFEKPRALGEYEVDPGIHDHILLFGCDRTGKMIIPILKNLKNPVLVVDFNPHVIRQLNAEGLPAVFGDISDPEVVESLKITEAKMIISTVGDVRDNFSALEILRKQDKKPIFIGCAQTIEDALHLYEMGADLVLIPNILTGEYISEILLGRITKQEISYLKDKQLKSFFLEKGI